MTTILLTTAGSRTQRMLLPHLRSAGRTVRAFGRRLDRQWFAQQGVADLVEGDLLDRPALERAMSGVDTVVHVGPPLSGSEYMMGRNVIDAARTAQVRRFVFISVIHPQIEYLLNHQAKCRIEDYLISSRLKYTVLQPQHYFQNIDIAQVLRAGEVTLPYDMGRALGFVDMADLAEAAAKVVLEPGHDYATYQIASDEHLSGEAIAAIIARLAGTAIGSSRIPLDRAVEIFAPIMGTADGNVDATTDLIVRLFSYYDRYGINGNGKVLQWLLGRPPTSFESYVSRGLKEVRP